jgi:glycosyltransferase involved in cell wall biosynthesis
MACGVPVVVSDIPVLVETTGARALRADPFNPAAWKGAIERLENKDFYVTQLEKGLRWAQALLGKKAWQEYISDIQQLLAQHPHLL